MTIRDSHSFFGPVRWAVVVILTVITVILQANAEIKPQDDLTQDTIHSQRKSQLIELSANNIIAHGGLESDDGGGGPELLLTEYNFWNPNPKPWFVTFDFSNTYTVNEVKITNTGDSVHDVTSFAIESSSDNEQWTIVDVITNVASGNSQPQYFQISGRGRYWKLTIKETASVYQPWVSSFGFFGEGFSLNDFRDYEGYRLYFHGQGGRKQLNYSSSVNYCANLGVGATLAYPANTADLDVWQKAITDANTRSWYVWVGAIQQGLDGPWTWIDGTEVTPESWNPGFPKGGSQCAVAATPPGRLETKPCNVITPPLFCQIPSPDWHRVGADRFVIESNMVSWDEGRELCRSHGLDLYIPRDILAVAQFLADTFNPDVYLELRLGARGNGSNQVWLTNEVLTEDEPWVHSSFSSIAVEIDSCTSIVYGSYNGYQGIKEGKVLRTRDSEECAKRWSNVFTLCG